MGDIPAFTNLTSEELIARASALVPLLRKNALRADEERRIPEENIEALAMSGILNMFKPVRYGGVESDICTKLAVLSELARGCASTMWAATIWVDVNWLVALFPEQAQDEVFAQPDVRMTATLNPGGNAVKTKGGYLVTGTWRFNTGSQHAHWCAQPALIQDSDGVPAPALFLMPYSDLIIEDDWHVAGLRATGSNTVKGSEIFVPSHRVLPLGPLMHGEHVQHVNTSAIYRVHPAHFINTSIMPMPIGLAKSAFELFMERLPGSAITYTFYKERKEAPVTHLQVAEALMKTRAAELMAREVADRIDRQALSAIPFSVEERAQIRGATGYVTRLCHEAVEILRTASGANAIRLAIPMQRVARDMQAMSVHSMANPNSTLELFGRVLCGLAPNSHWI